jgi:hypothetical protein
MVWKRWEAEGATSTFSSLISVVEHLVRPVLLVKKKCDLIISQMFRFFR